MCGTWNLRAGQHVCGVDKNRVMRVANSAGGQRQQTRDCCCCYCAHSHPSSPSSTLSRQFRTTTSPPPTMTTRYRKTDRQRGAGQDAQSHMAARRNGLHTYGQANASASSLSSDIAVLGCCCLLHPHAPHADERERELVPLLTLSFSCSNQTLAAK